MEGRDGTMIKVEMKSRYGHQCVTPQPGPTRGMDVN